MTRANSLRPLRRHREQERLSGLLDVLTDIRDTQGPASTWLMDRQGIAARLNEESSHD